MDCNESTLWCKQKIVTIWQFLIPMELWYIMVDVWKTFCIKKIQLMVVYIPIYYCIMKLEKHEIMSISHCLPN